MSLRLLLSISLVAAWSLMSAQEVLISDEGTVNFDCTGSPLQLFDSGGDADGYGPGESFVFTFCPSEGGAIFSIDTETAGDVFDISGSDLITIFDGPDVDSPILGSFNNNNLPGPVIYIATTLENLTGCMTILFESGENSTGGLGFGANLNCGTPWQPFDLSFSSSPVDVDDEGYIDVCKDTEITLTSIGDFPFSGGNGYEQTDENLLYEWDLGDGTQIQGIGVNSITHTFPEQAGYPIELFVTDTEGLRNRYVIKVRVSTTPRFSALLSQYQDTICQGNSLTLTGGLTGVNVNGPGVVPTTGQFVSGGFLAGQTFLPDGSGISYETVINLSDFPQDELLDDVDDVVSICATMEHSYLGDLDIAITCPNGQSIVLQNQGGGSCNLGIPWATGGVDGESTNTTPGEGFEYCWTPAATLSLEEGCGDQIDFPNGDGPGTYSDTQVEEGDYAPDEAFDGLLGCPVNGNWTITVTDNIGADNGYIFSWGIEFSSDIQPDIETYQPELVSGFWSPEPTITEFSDTIITVQPIDPGTYNYTFNVTDNFDCSYDTTIQVVVIPDYEISIATDQACSFSTQVNVDGTYQGGFWSIEGQTEDFAAFFSKPAAGAVMDSSLVNAQNSEVATITYFDGFCQTSKELTTFFRPFPIATISYNGDTLPTHPDWEPDEEETIIDMVEYDSLYLCIGDETVLTALGQPIAITEPIYTWSIGGADVATLNETILPVDVNDLIQAAAGNPNIEIMLEVEDAMCPGVFSTAVIPVVPEGCFPYNIVTPNGDGMNDNFVIGGATRLRNNYLLVYNRWGNQVFEQRAYKNDWSPTDLPDGTYFYVFTSDSKGGEFNGSFTISGSQN